MSYEDRNELIFNNETKDFNELYYYNQVNDYNNIEFRNIIINENELKDILDFDELINSFNKMHI